jgi:hypothetical protein
MPIRSYLESPAARVILDGKPFATVSISRRYYGINLGRQRKLGETNGGRFTDKTHFVAAGGQVKSMLSWLGYMKHGEPARLGLNAAEPEADREQAKPPTVCGQFLRPVAAGGTGDPMSRPAQNRRPNILLVMTDQLRFQRRMSR